MLRSAARSPISSNVWIALRVADHPGVIAWWLELKCRARPLLRPFDVNPTFQVVARRFANTSVCGE